jgi:hypothetical protein
VLEGPGLGGRRGASGDGSEQARGSEQCIMADYSMMEQLGRHDLIQWSQAVIDVGR